MRKEYEKLLFTELRMIVIKENKNELDDARIACAMTLNENLKSLGYTLRPEDVIAAAKSGEDLKGIYDRVVEFAGEVKAKPMYPDFPSQVMEIDEAVFRFHQLVHYFSTYGIRALGGTVTRGWLPEMEETEKTREDASLLEAKVLEAVPESRMWSLPYERILGKRERMNIKEETIIRECVCHHVDPDTKIPFKENIVPVFCAVADSDADRERKLEILKHVCQHTGDVWKCFELFLIGRKWHLKTSEKKLFVKLFESYPAEDFESNLILTNKKAGRVITLLEFLSYNRFSKSAGHKAAVSALRNGELRSWGSRMEEKIGAHADDTVAFIGQRPGMLLRSVNRLLNEGYPAEEIRRELVAHADKLALPTLVSVITHFSKGGKK